MGTDLALHNGDLFESAKRWADMEPGERRRRAIEACRDRDLPTLWDLTESHALLYGKAGSKMSPHTRSAYRQGVNLLLRSWSHLSLIHTTRDDAAVFVRALEQQGYSASTVQVRLAGARALYRALRWAGAIDSDPLADIRPAKDPTPAHAKRQPYPDADVDRLLAVATGTDTLLILLGAHGGLRVSEMLDLQWVDIDLAARRLTVRHGKGGKTRRVIVSQKLADALRSVNQTVNPADNAWVISDYRTTESARARMKRLCRIAQVPCRAVHALRHTAGTRLYRETGKLEIAQMHLGHADISTTQIYVKWSDESVEDSVGNW